MPRTDPTNPTGPNPSNPDPFNPAPTGRNQTGRRPVGARAPGRDPLWPYLIGLLGVLVIEGEFVVVVYRAVSRGELWQGPISLVSYGLVLMWTALTVFVLLKIRGRSRTNRRGDG